MPFDTKKFLKEKFVPRTEDVPVPDMKVWFVEGEKPVWTVRGMTGQELGRASEAAERNKSIGAILEGLLAQESKEKTHAVKELLGMAGGTPPDIAKRIEWLIMASVQPVCTLDLALKVCEVFPIEFFQITNVIMQLTGRGQVPGKQKPSGAIPKSGNVSPSDTPEGDSSMKSDPTSSRPDT